jgi:hypothetical protein
MYNTKDIKIVGKHDYDKESAERFASWGGKSFSVNVFQWGLKSNGKEMKPLKGVVRVSGRPINKEKVFAEVERIVNLLDAGKWDGRKSVVVK